MRVSESQLKGVVSSQPALDALTKSRKRFSLFNIVSFSGGRGYKRLKATLVFASVVIYMFIEVE